MTGKMKADYSDIRFVNTDGKKLAYQIDGESKGYYLFMNVQIPPASVKKIISDFRLNSDILRYLFVKVTKAATA